MKTMHPVGRLDADTSGLLLFSSDGHLTQLLLHPTTGIEREYEAVVAETVDPEVLGPKLAGGIKTTDGTFAADLLYCKNLDEVLW
jgi:23S rRNA pseudouridine2605 synthase